MAEDTIFKQQFLKILLLAMMWTEITRVSGQSGGASTVPVHYILSEIVEDKPASNLNKLEIFCYKGYDKRAVHLFSTVVLHLYVQEGRSGYEYYQGARPEDIVDKYEEQQSSWSLSTNWFTHTSERQGIVLRTFHQDCVGVKTSSPYSVVVNVISVDFSKVISFCCGLLLFLLAPTLSHNDLFFYVCGVVLGISASFLIVSYFVSKLLPKKSLMIGAVLSSWSFGFFVLKYLLENFQFLLKVYFHYVLGYIIAAGFVSFAVCYRMGPPSNPRSKNLIQWALQGCAIGLLWSSSSHDEMKSAIIFIVLLLYNFPSLWMQKIQTYWTCQFPPKQQFLSEEEFIEQGAKETQKALEDLKGYCRSPDCNQWKTILHVKNPRRFAEFMSGAPHVSNEELLAYELYSRSVQDDIYTDDDSDQSDQEEESCGNSPYANKVLE